MRPLESRQLPLSKAFALLSVGGLLIAIGFYIGLAFHTSQPRDDKQEALTRDSIAAAVRQGIQEQLQANLHQLQHNSVDSVHHAAGSPDCTVKPSSSRAQNRSNTKTTSHHVTRHHSLPSWQPIEIRWTGGYGGKRCIDVDARWNGKARAMMCNGHATEWQKLVLNEAGQLEHTGRCLDVTKAQAYQPVAVTPCAADRPGQLWAYDPKTDLSGYKTELNLRLTAPIISKASGLCLALGHGYYPEPLTTVPCTSSCNLTWMITRDKRQVTYDKHLASLDDDVRTKSPRIVCWIMTHYGNRHKAIAVNNTWGRRCDHLMFMSTTPDTSLPMVLLDIGGRPESNLRLRIKSKQGWLHVYKHYLDKGDFFLKGDDDSYVVMEQLKAFLRTRDPDAPEHYGRLLYRGGNRSQPFFSGGSTIIATREALRRMGEGTAARGDAIWPGPADSNEEDFRFSQVMELVGVKPVSTRAWDGKHVFLVLGIDQEREIRPPADRAKPHLWFWQYSFDAIAGPGCCSERWIASHYTQFYQMYALDALERSQCKAEATSWPWLELPVAASNTYINS